MTHLCRFTTNSLFSFNLSLSLSHTFIFSLLKYSIISDSINVAFQELIAALLACAFFCLFPASNRGANHLPTINFDELFAYVTS